MMQIDEDAVALEVYQTMQPGHGLIPAQVRAVVYKALSVISTHHIAEIVRFFDGKKTPNRLSPEALREQRRKYVKKAIAPANGRGKARTRNGKGKRSRG